MTTPTISAALRTLTGHKANQLRRAGLIPAVIYGRGVSSRPLAVKAADFTRLFRSAGESTVIDLVVDGAAPVKALIQDVARDPLSNEIIHADFRGVSLTEKISARIPLRFSGEAPIVASGGGALVRHLDHLEVKALPQDLAHEIIVELSPLAALNSAIHIRELAVPAGIEVINKPEETVVSVAEIVVEEEAPAAAASIESVEVVGKEEKKEGGEKAAPEEAGGEKKGKESGK